MPRKSQSPFLSPTREQSLDLTGAIVLRDQNRHLDRYAKAALAYVRAVNAAEEGELSGDIGVQRALADLDEVAETIPLKSLVRMELAKSPGVDDRLLIQPTPENLRQLRRVAVLSAAHVATLRDPHGEMLDETFHVGRLQREVRSSGSVNRRLVSSFGEPDVRRTLLAQRERQLLEVAGLAGLGHVDVHATAGAALSLIAPRMSRGGQVLEAMWPELPLLAGRLKSVTVTPASLTAFASAVPAPARRAVASGAMQGLPLGVEDLSEQTIDVVVAMAMSCALDGIDSLDRGLKELLPTVWSGLIDDFETTFRDDLQGWANERLGLGRRSETTADVMGVEPLAHRSIETNPFPGSFPGATQG